MKCVARCSLGDIVAPLPHAFQVQEDELVLPNGEAIRHGDQFNVAIISHFLVAVKELHPDDEIIVNLNLAFYSAAKSGDLRITNSIAPGFRFLDEETQQALYLFADESVRQAAIADGFVPKGQEGGITVQRTRKDTLVATSTKDQASGEVVFESTGVILPFPVRSTIEIPGDRHLRLTGGSEFIRHSCVPNLRLEIVGDLIRGIALRPIEAGEYLTYNYLCTEWDVTKVFHCQCNVYCCYGVIKGFKYLDREQQEHLLPHCSPAVVEKYRGPLLPSASLGAIHSSSALCHTHTGHLAAQRSISAGTVLLSLVNPPKEKGLSLLLEPSHSCLPHSCDANTVIIENQLVVCRPLVPGDVLTFNLNLQHHDIPDGLPCTCDSASCNKTVKGFHALSPSQQSTLWIYASPEVRQAALQQHHHRITCSSPWATVKESGSMGHATYAAKPITTGTRVFHVKGLILPFPTVYTIHLGEGKHLLFADGAQCLAHSCAPNTRIVVDPMNGFVDCFAMQPIAQDELISFNYLTTEWDMNEPFVCACGSSRCAKMIKGFRHLPRNEQLALWPYATDAIRALFAQSSRSTLANLRMDLVCPLGEKGELCVPKDLPSGTVLLETGGEHFDINGGYICFGDCRIRHSCSATALLLEGKVVLNQSVLADTPITLNINQLVYRLPEAWTCTCGSMHCNQRIMGFQGMPAAQQHELLLGTLPRVRDEAVADGYQNMSDSPYVVIAANGEMGQATFAAKTIAAGTRFFEVTGLVLPFPTVYTILLEPTRHLLFASGAQCLAHSCKPNVRIVVDAERRSLNCVALRPINAGELISFNYLTTEWDMNTAFPCVCGEAGCSGKIRGFKYLAAEDRQRLWWMATPAIRRLAGGANPNWEKLASPTLRTDATGRVCAATELHEGLPVLDAATVELCGSRVVVDGISLNHSCQPTAAIIDHRVVLIQSMCRGVEVTIDLNCLSYALDEPFTCTCPAQPQPHRVEGFQTMPEAQRTARLIFTDAAVRAAALRDGYVVPCPDPLVVVRAHGEMGQATFAATPIAAGARFLSVKGLCLPFPTIYTIMLTESRHLLFADGAQCLAHSCNPNVQICVDFINNVLECVALRPIHEGELIAFNYNTTEWHMSSPFRCACGAPSCAYEIRGFKHLTRAARESILPQVSPTIRQLALDHADVQLPAVLRSREDGTLEAAATLPKEFVVLEVMYLDVQPAQLCVGRNCFIPHHSTTYNCVLVEGRIVTCAEVATGSPLLINMNYFVYDMTAQFPRAYVEDCKGFKYMEEALKQKYLYLCEPPVRAQAMRDGWIVHSSQDALTVRPNGEMGQTAYATRDITTGTTLFHCDGLIVPFPTMYTICVGPRRHLLFGDAAECIAHHCDPNVRVTVNGDGTFDFVTITPIATGEMVTFNYTTTEWLMNSPFVCLCGSTYCAGIVQGFKHLSNADCQRLWPITSDVVREEYRKRANNNNSDHAMKA